MNHYIKGYFVVIACAAAVVLECYRVNMPVPSTDNAYALYATWSWTLNSLAMVIMAAIIFAAFHNKAVRVMMVLLMVLHGYLIIKLKLGIADSHKWFDWCCVLVGSIICGCVLFGKEKEKT